MAARHTSNSIRARGVHSLVAPIRSSRAAPWWRSTPGAQAVIRFLICTCPISIRRIQLRLRNASRSLGGAARSYVGEASVVVDQVMNAINPYGLHLAFLDPFNLAQLPFSIIERMLRVKRMDMIIHVSLQDLQRNLDDYTREGGTLDMFAPGWRNEVNARPINGCPPRGARRVLARVLFARLGQIPRPAYH